MRTHKFRGKRISDCKWTYGYLLGRNFIGKVIHNTEGDAEIIEVSEVDEKTVGQFIGLKDKNGTGQEVYEGDIIGVTGKVIGNKYEDRTLLENKVNLLIQGFGTKAWLATYKEAVARGCDDTK